MADSFTTRLADFATAPVTPSGPARQTTVLSALDWLAVGRAGSAEPVSRILRAQATEEGGAPQARLFGGGAAPARMAALVNGTVSHALDYDDTHFAHIGHPSVAVFPAALAMGERQGGAIAGVLEAALVGMEVSIRVGVWLGRGHYQRGFHQTATAGAFGAAVAAGRLAGLDAQAMTQVLGLTATRAAGLKVQFGTMAKPYNAGLAASCGVEAALLVARGFQANPDAMSGEFGFAATHHGAGDIDKALAGLGEHWLFETVSHKFHACCHGLHAALEAARDLDLAAPEIAELSVRTHPRWMSVCNQPMPTTGLGAKFSYGTVLAMRALGYDTARLDSYTDQICADPKVRGLRAMVRVEADDSLSETEAVVTVLRRDGVRREAHHDLAAPMEMTDREARVREKAQNLIGETSARAIWSLLRGGGAVEDLAALVSE
ncbi:MmgE/PrpD family protein [Aliisedimentitalea scapharcae]|uniref:MmgE/PrpD family protein n=1 Tax=Aliisedimentitalea scapharcae TaxID=1524259 RepID=A0ABZ2XMZ6_9RHOB